MMSLKNGLKFNSINESFNGCKENLSKPSLDSSKIRLSQKSGESTSSFEESGEGEIEDFKSSYVLTMSQAPTTTNDGDINKSLIFEPCEEVNRLIRLN